MFCTNCGNQLKDGYKFCPKCGTPAYVKKEQSQIEVKKEETEEVAIEENEPMTSTLPPSSTDSEKNTPEIDTSEKETSETITSTSPPTPEPPSTHLVPNPLIAMELDIEGVKEKAEQGDMIAMLRQAFRYEMGIGVEKDMDKAEELYRRCDSPGTDVFLWTSDYLLSCILSQDLCVSSK